MTQLLIHLPDTLVRKFRASVASKQRSKYLERLLSDDLVKKDAELLASALAIEEDSDINDLIKDFEVVTGDGFNG